MLVTVAVCTWNRAKLLDQTLAQMCKLRIPKGVEWELLVVNNNCTDNTEQVVGRYRDRLPLRPLFEQKQGHSNARNCAIDAARGELMIWTDDDVLVDENWLAESAKAANAFPSAVYFGGTINPWLEAPVPRWLQPHWHSLQGLFVLRNFGDYVGPIQPGQVPAGANMAIRMDIQKMLRFETRLGRVKDTLSGADDTEIIERLRKQSMQGVWVGTARVSHYIPADRLSIGFLRRWYIGAGQTAIRQSGFQRDCSLIWGVPRWLFRQYAIERSKSIALAPFRNRKWHDSFRMAMMLRGFMIEYRSHNAQAISSTQA
jgi:glucosyl-dolichyl phosphate glucuronosyltransferase